VLREMWVSLTHFLQNVAFPTYPRFCRSFKILDTPKARRSLASRKNCPIYLYLLYIIYRGKYIHGDMSVQNSAKGLGYLVFSKRIDTLDTFVVNPHPPYALGCPEIFRCGIIWTEIPKSVHFYLGTAHNDSYKICPSHETHTQRAS
jgi:hypothetical protein